MAETIPSIIEIKPKHPGLQKFEGEAAADFVDLAKSDDPNIAKAALDTLVDAVKGAIHLSKQPTAKP